MAEAFIGLLVTIGLGAYLVYTLLRRKDSKVHHDARRLG
jgi:K+-transporting ATPase KdpF subunit